MADAQIGIFTLAGGILAALSGGVTEYLRERWARSRDVAAREAARAEMRDEFQRESLLKLQESVLALSIELAEAMDQKAPSATPLRKRMLETGSFSQRVFDVELRKRVNVMLSRYQLIMTGVRTQRQISEDETSAFVEALNATQDRTRELLEDLYRSGVTP